MGVGINIELIEYSILIIGISLIGGLMPLFNRKTQYIKQFISFGAGTFIAAVFLRMLPESIELANEKVSYAVFAGFLLLYIIERFVMIHICEAGECDYHTIGLSAFFGLSLHSFIDGVALGSGIEASPELGAIILFAILAHKAPAAFSLTSVMLHANYNKKEIIKFLIIFSIMVPLGAIISSLVLRSLTENILGIAIAFSAGTFLHIAVSDLLPEVHKARSGRNISLVVFLIGIAIVYLSTFI